MINMFILNDDDGMLFASWNIFYMSSSFYAIFCLHPHTLLSHIIFGGLVVEKSSYVDGDPLVLFIACLLPVLYHCPHTSNPQGNLQFLHVAVILQPTLLLSTLLLSTSFFVSHPFYMFNVYIHILKGIKSFSIFI